MSLKPCQDMLSISATTTALNTSAGTVTPPGSLVPGITPVAFGVTGSTGATRALPSFFATCTAL